MFARIILSALICFASLGWSWDSGWDAGDIPATASKTNTENFDGILSPTDVNVQLALDTIDDLVIPSPDLSLYAQKTEALLLDQTTPQTITGLSDGYLKLTSGVIGTGTIDLSGYAKLDGSNQPFTGDIKLQTGASDYARISRIAANNALTLYNRVIGSGSAGKGVTIVNTNEVIASSGTGAFNITQATGFSVAMWIKPANAGTQTILIEKDPMSGGSNRFFYSLRRTTKEVQFTILSSGASSILAAGSSIASTGTIEDGVWYHVGLSYSQTNGARIYINGSIDGSSAYNANSITPNNGHKFTFGNSDTGTQSSAGTIDEPLVFNRELTSSEFAEIYNAGLGFYGDVTKAPYNSGLQIGYHLDEGSGTSVADFSGNNNSASIVNNASPTWATGKVLLPANIAEVDVIKAEDSAGSGSKISLGNNSSDTIINGSTVKVQINGTTVGTVDASGDVALTGNLTASNLSGTNTGDQVADGVTITGDGTIADPFVATATDLSGYIAKTATKTILIDGDFYAQYLVSTTKKITPPDLGYGYTITRVVVQASTASPTTQFKGDLKRSDAQGTGAFPGANPTVIKVLDTTTGNYDSGVIAEDVATGKELYIQMDSNVDYGVMWTITITYTLKTS